MNIADFITELYCTIDDALPDDAPQHPQAVLSLGELITIGVLQAMKNVGQRAFYHWLQDNYGDLFPQLPERSRLNRRLETQSCWVGRFLAEPTGLAEPTVLGVADSYGVELGHPVRSGRDVHQVGRKANPITAGSWAANSASCSTSGAGS